MHTTDRRAALVAILLGALGVFLLSACGAPDQPRTAAQPTAAPLSTAPTAGVASTAVIAEPVYDIVPPAPATAAASTASAPTATSIDGTATAALTSTIAATQTATTPTPEAADETDPFTGTDDLIDSDDITVTVELTATGALTVTHPVAIAIADYFGVPIAEVIALHADGLGFGEIGRAYFLSRELAADADPANNLTASQILAMHVGGMGWGQIVVVLDLPHGNSGRNLGLIMRARKQHQETLVVVATGAEADEHGAPAVPPGQKKDKDKQHGKGHGNGHGNGKKGK
jgi:hypothetical protein